MSMIEKLKEKSLRPKKTIGRFVNLSMIILASTASTFAYFFIHFHICDNLQTCADLKISRLFLTLSPLYIVYSLCCIGVAVFLFKSKNLPSIYSDCIALSVTFGLFFTCIGPIIIAYELSLFS
ncbi:MAG: hypothetical protein ACRBCI_05200 [Cellvibrionaceae bacterium]